MLDYLASVALATFWAWETVRYAAERYAPGWFAATRALHPLVVAAAPVYLLGVLHGLAIAAVVGILHSAVERFLIGPAGGALALPGRSRRSNLPRLP